MNETPTRTDRRHCLHCEASVAACDTTRALRSTWCCNQCTGNHNAQRLASSPGEGASPSLRAVPSDHCAGSGPSPSRGGTPLGGSRARLSVEAIRTARLEAVGLVRLNLDGNLEDAKAMILGSDDVAELAAALSWLSVGILSLAGDRPVIDEVLARLTEAAIAE